jgi:hypothetical protein
MPAPIHLNHQPPPKIGEIHDERPDGRLPPEMQPKHPVQLAKLPPDPPLLRRHLRPQLSCALPGDGVDTRHLSRPLPKAPHPIPPDKGEGGTRRPPPAPKSTEQAPPLPLVGRGGGWGAGEATSIWFRNMRPCWMRGFMGHTLLVECACPTPPTPSLPTRGREAPDARHQYTAQPKRRLPSPLWGGDGGGGRERRPRSGSGT